MCQLFLHSVINVQAAWTLWLAMKASEVTALRSKYGLRPARRDAEPQVVGLTPQTTNERRANTMKTYILRDPKTVELQNDSIAGFADDFHL